MSHASALRKPSPTPHPNLVTIARVLHVARDEKIADFLAYYRGIHPADRLPSRRDFDPMAVPRLLPHLILVEVVHGDRPGFRIKVAGEEIVRAFRMPLQGRRLEDIAEEDEPGRPYSILTRAAVAKSGLVAHYCGAPRMRFALDFADIEYVHCPLAEDGVTVDQIVSVFHYHGFDSEP
ncbi:PAS domain-containing protein [Ferrovibrio sp.]|uniref:PAS domain-containing protein n=1 Tax=Ferrovibrio sp. TaxID=1917215 RepID=UPI00262241FB|nr:PAS domain-containing protein [Ferrovibrio sp.]